MCKIINASSFLALLLSDVDEVTCETALSIQDMIETEYPNVIIDFTSDSILKAEKRYPYLFKIDSNIIERRRGFTKIRETFLKNEFYNSIDEEIIEKIKKEVKNT